MKTMPITVLIILCLLGIINGACHRTSSKTEKETDSIRIEAKYFDFVIPATATYSTDILGCTNIFSTTYDGVEYTCRYIPFLVPREDLLMTSLYYDYYTLCSNSDYKQWIDEFCDSTHMHWEHNTLVYNNQIGPQHLKYLVFHECSATFCIRQIGSEIENQKLPKIIAKEQIPDADIEEFRMEYARFMNNHLPSDIDDMKIVSFYYDKNASNLRIDAIFNDNNIDERTICIDLVDPLINCIPYGALVFYNNDGQHFTPATITVYNRQKLAATISFEKLYNWQNFFLTIHPVDPPSQVKQH